MLSEQQERFRQDGYLIVRDVLSAQQVASLRAFLQPRFEALHPGPATTIGVVTGSQRNLFNVYKNHPEVRWLLFHEPALQAFRSLLGDDFVFTWDAEATWNGFGGLHTDTTSQEGLRYKYFLAPDCVMGPAAYYLQDNSDEYGGGLSVIPGSHLSSDDPFIAHTTLEKVLNRLVYPHISYFGSRAWTERRVDRTALVDLPLKAGDLLIFHHRLTHGATPKKAATLPPGREKIAIFITWSVNTPHHVKCYHDYLLSRQGPANAFIHDFAWPAEVRQQAKDVGVSLTP